VTSGARRFAAAGRRLGSDGERQEPSAPTDYEQAIDHHRSDTRRAYIVGPLALSDLPVKLRLAEIETRGEGMKKRSGTLLGILGCLVLVALPTVYGQSEERVIASIPFEFTAGNRTLPAGDYTINRAENTPGMMLLRSEDSHSAVFFAVENTYSLQIAKQTELVFNKVGDRYFLSQIWVAGEDLGRELPKSRAERELERNPTKQIAKVVKVTAGHQA
jgi:hypothetical protein